MAAKIRRQAVKHKDVPRLIEQAELLEGIPDFNEELIPTHEVNAILDGQNPIKVWREYRGMTQGQSADIVRISKPTLSQIETGKRPGTTDVLSATAKALDVTLEQVAITERT